MRLRQIFVLAAVTLGIAALPVLGLPLTPPHILAFTAPAHSSSPPAGTPDLPSGVIGVAMAIRLKDTGTIAKKFASRAGQASQEYASGVAGAGPDWQANALAGEGNYEQGVTAAIADKRYGRGISSAGAQKYTDNATKLGPQRFQTGVANAEGAFAKGVQPYLDAVRNLDLPPRGPKGSPQNQQRANVVATRLRAVKTGK